MKTLNLGFGTPFWRVCSSSVLLLLSSVAFSAESVKIRLCNSTDQKIFSAVAYEPDSSLALMSRGWWAIESKKCTDIDLPLGSDRILLYANSENLVSEWRGDVELCIDIENKFDFSNASTMACETELLKKKLFKELSLNQLRANSGADGVPKFEFSKVDATKVADAVKICNDFSEPVFVAYAQHDGDEQAVSVAGWFKVLSDRCYEAKRSQGATDLLLFANSENGNRRWKGDVPLCINAYDKFNFDDANSRDCRGNKERLQKFKKIGMGQSGDFEYHLKPMLSETGRSMVVLCNSSQQKIIVSIAFANPDFPGQYVASGWYGIDAEKCSNALPVDSEVLQVFVEGEDGQVLRSGAFSACVDSVSAFEYGDATAMQCTSESQVKKDFDSIRIEAGAVKLNLP